MRFSNLLSPLCLVVSLIMLVLAFAILASEPPGESVQIHSARASGDELAEAAMKTQLTGKIWFRRLLLAALFCGSVLMILVSFVTMRGKA